MRRDVATNYTNTMNKRNLNVTLWQAVKENNCKFEYLSHYFSVFFFFIYAYFFAFNWAWYDFKRPNQVTDFIGNELSGIPLPIFCILSDHFTAVRIFFTFKRNKVYCCVATLSPQKHLRLFRRHLYMKYFLLLMGSRDGAVVIALAFLQCGRGSNPRPGAISGLSLLSVLVLAPRVFLRVLRFSSLHKNQHF